MIFVGIILLFVLIANVTSSYSENFIQSPKKQLESGVLPEDITCRENLILAIRNNGNVACVRESTSEKLGWIVIKDTFESMPHVDNNEISTLYVDSKLVDCIGIVSQQCMFVREDQNSEWKFFYNDITGFDYQPGYNYKLSVSVIEISNPPADASSIQYQLIKVDEKIKVENNISNPAYVKYPDASLIKKDIDSIGDKYHKYYSKYIDYKTPNGNSIYIVAQDKISDEQVLRAMNILGFYLTDVSGSQYGTNKSVIANKMASNNAVLVMPNGADGKSPIPDDGLLGQPLYQLEFPVEGSLDYIHNNYDRRDAGFEEILHLVQDTGIGVDGNVNVNPGVLPEYQKEIRDATNHALSAKIWASPQDVQGWLEELRQDNSLPQEYLASVIDSYYGLWGSFDGDGGMWGIYEAKTRSDIPVIDPQGIEIVEKFFSPTITYMTRIDSNFEGLFLMSFDQNNPYTHKSQYLVNAQLLGSKNSDISGNYHDNIFIGNAGNNIIDGENGFDIVQFSGNYNEYIITQSSNEIIVEDVLNRDGIDTLRNIELLRFTDKDISS